MPTDTQNPPGATSVSLARGILSDVQLLARQQVALSKMEARAAIRRARVPASLLAAGLVALLLSAGELAHTLSHFLHWLASPPATDPAWAPLWQCHGAAALTLGAVGAPLLYAAAHRWRNPAPKARPTTNRASNG